MTQNKVGQITMRIGPIECKVHYDGNVMSIGLLNSANEKLFTLGIGQPGTFNFTASLGEEHTLLLWGEVAINGRRLQVGETSVTPKDETVRIEAQTPFAYFCRFERRGDL